MTTIQRYVLWEIIKIFLLCLGVTVLMMTVGGGVNEGLKKGLPPNIILNMLPYFVPEMLRYTIPGCMLFAVCTTFGRMAATNEVTAIKSAGINPMELVWPVLIFAYFLSFFTFWMYDVCAAWSRPNIHRVIAESLDDTVYGVLQTKRSFKMSGIEVTVKEVKDRKLIKPRIDIAATESRPQIYLEAAEAELNTDPETGTLKLSCRDGKIEQGNSQSYDFSDEFVLYLDELNSVELDVNSASPANLTLATIPDQITREQKIVQEAKAELEIAIASDDFDHLNAVEGHLKANQKRLFRLQAERQRRLANGFGVFCFVVMGVPVSIWLKSSDNVRTFFVCFLPILLLYYPLLVVGEQWARDGNFGSAPVWIADVVLLAVGAFLMWRVNRN
ncbi:LptF/LptG family permease [Bremerella cremea]|uniref:LptF/LptG family permease n=1 Tax=Bremerella cremea TaxID=1031537 RepID=A0A368KWQ3_9BACT|nr:LptF/LptG family permease [Bremerella cremea]RCS52799.1 LptF/LptG family permease [Bremerella cremea]